ncbi:hypothetical protein HYT53_02370 [Candidatus Woesearchaeota archaeon]|nr:hypothetical protein [Candidatus Woesearchaeota archaeon]
MKAKNFIKKQKIYLLYNRLINQRIPNNQTSEPKTNNYVLRPFIQKPIPAYLEVNTGYDKADETI